MDKRNARKLTNREIAILCIMAPLVGFCLYMSCDTEDRGRGRIYIPPTHARTVESTTQPASQLEYSTTQPDYTQRNR